MDPLSLIPQCERRWWADWTLLKKIKHELFCDFKDSLLSRDSIIWLDATRILIDQKTKSKSMKWSRSLKPWGSNYDRIQLDPIWFSERRTWKKIICWRMWQVQYILNAERTITKSGSEWKIIFVEDYSKLLTISTKNIQNYFPFYFFEIQRICSNSTKKSWKYYSAEFEPCCISTSTRFEKWKGFFIIFLQLKMNFLFKKGRNLSGQE